MRLRDAFLEAEKIAGRSSIKRYKTGCVLLNSRGQIVSRGWSHMGQANLAEYYSVHAELHAILRAGRGRLKGGSAIVFNYSGRSGATALAKPCDRCEALLRNEGIRVVSYSTPTGFDLLLLDGSASLKRVTT